MKEMLMLLASQMPKELIIEKLIEGCNEYNEAELINNKEKMEEANNHLFISCNLFIMNLISDGSAEKAMGHIKKMGEIEKAHKFFQTNKN